MRHNVKKARLGRRSKPRKALIRSQITALVENGSIKTTLSKGREIARLFDKMVTRVRRQSTQREQIRSAKTELYTEAAQRRLITELIPAFKQTSGYSTLEKLGLRGGDAAMMVKITLITS